MLYVNGEQRKKVSFEKKRFGESDDLLAQKPAIELLDSGLAWPPHFGTAENDRQEDSQYH